MVVYKCISRIVAERLWLWLPAFISGNQSAFVPSTPLQFVSWVRTCVTSPKFSVMISGSLEGLFSGRKGLRFHDRCESVGWTHLVFADDLMIFYAAEKDSLEFVRQVLADFAGYLGLPLLAGRLRAVDCAPLIQRITARIRSWTAQSLSFAGSYFWKGSAMSRGSARVAWDEVCLPLGEGGLGVKHVASWNQVAIMKLL
ncbi:uncharacterized protein LOC120088982 [Benincasa hispida]|uniref:uncharacterized protein LOC120088982 n=1 Tax=Benincasa hispida TaxID=102211 RepID=UPI0019019C91|nr:uncharacterized protein LOC120088982 [Benincasa hispida]